MELHALGRQLAVAQGHQHSPAPGGLLEAVGQVGVDHERVVAPDRERRGEAVEDRAPVMLDARGLAMHRLVELPAPAEGLRERLVAKAHPQRGHPRLRHPAHELQRDPGLLGRAWTGRDHAALIRALEQLVHAGPVVADDVDLGPQLAEVLHEVVSERVVVVEDQDPWTGPDAAVWAHGQSGCLQGDSLARSAALVLATDSSNSYSGLACATVPPPACTWATPSL